MISKVIERTGQIDTETHVGTHIQRRPNALPQVPQPHSLISYFKGIVDVLPYNKLYGVISFSY